MQYESLIAATSLALSGASAFAEEIDCPSINASTHYHASSSASATEGEGRCTVSVNNADADSMGFSSSTLWCLSRGFASGKIDSMLASGNIDVDILGQIVALLTVPSVPVDYRAGWIGDGVNWPESGRDCDAFVDSLAGFSADNIKTELSARLDTDFGAAVASCLFDGEIFSPVDSCNRMPSSLQIGYSSYFGQHIVAIPR